MALNPDKIQFLYNQIYRAEHNTISSVIGQLFSYLDNEIKDNPIFDKYQQERSKWSEWPHIDESAFNFQWELPKNLEDAKSLAYDIYRSAAENNNNWLSSFAFNLYHQRSMSENIDKLNNTFLGYFEQVLEEIINANPEIDIQKPNQAKGNTVFIIHGHDNELKKDVQLLLKNAGVNCFVLHEQPDRGRTIIDKLIEETNSAGYAIALLTPDDLTSDGVNRARQNVILEIGYFLGKIGKERLRMIVKENIDIPSDLQGILYEKHDSNGAWKIKLLKEIQAVGIYVDIQGAIDSF